MSIKPVDFQVIIPKTAEISKIHNDEHNKNHAFQQQQVNTMQQKSESITKQVYSQEKAHESRIRERQEKHREGRKGESGKDSGKKRKNEKSNRDFRESTIDIKI